MSELVIYTLILFNIFTLLFSNCQLRIISFILLCQCIFGYIASYYINSPILFGVNIFIDVLALELISNQWVLSKRDKRNYLRAIDLIQVSICAMVVTHFCAVFNLITTFDKYYLILNWLSLLNVILLIIGGVLRLINGLDTNQTTGNNRAYKGTIYNNKGAKK